MPTLERIRRCMRDFEPELIVSDEARRASVALIVREHEGDAEVLLIERATRSGDPWSGHMAFPGGRLEESDSTTRAAAERETFEEVGVALAGAEYLGLLGELQGNPRYRPTNLVVSAHVFHVKEPEPVVLEESEVAHALWFPVKDLLHPDRHVDYSTPHVGNATFPGILVGDPERHIVWGLTYRFLDIFLEAIERPLPDRWGDIDAFDGADAEE
jgi:8-oxo-dGTP pyrophosphatase MutT (NUDIX family)